MTEITGRAQLVESIKGRRYECFIEDHEPLPWTPGRCAGYAGRTAHLMRCRRKDGHGPGGLFCAQHARRAEAEAQRIDQEPTP